MVDYSKWDRFAENLSDSDEEIESPSVRKLTDGSQVTIDPNGITVHEPEPSSRKQQRNEYILDYSETGGVCESFSWYQSRENVIVDVAVPVDTKARDIIVQYESESNTLNILLKNHKFVGGALKYPLDVEDNIDWELKDTSVSQNSRTLQLVLKKKSLIPNATLWWNSVFHGDPEIDVTKIKGRKSEGSDTWSQAHELFKQRIADRGANLIDI